MTTVAATEPRYYVVIGAAALKQPPDLSAIAGVNPRAQLEIRGEFTEREFARLCDRPIIEHMRRRVELSEDYGGWTIEVCGEDVIENMRTALTRCIDALLNRDYPNSDAHAYDLSREWDLTPQTLDFLMSVYEAAFDPWEEPDDNVFLDLMQNHGIRYEDLATAPPA